MPIYPKIGGLFCGLLVFNKDCSVRSQYCRFGYFRENFIFANSIKIHISDVKISRLTQDLHIISINDRVILPFPDGFIL